MSVLRSGNRRMAVIVKTIDMIISSPEYLVWAKNKSSEQARGLKKQIEKIDQRILKRKAWDNAESLRMKERRRLNNPNYKPRRRGPSKEDRWEGYEFLRKMDSSGGSSKHVDQNMERN